MKIRRLFNVLYTKLFRINDTPQRIALGLGLGVFSGILPGTGPLASLFLAFVFRANRASALIGSLFTNTWLSFLTFFLALKIGAATFGTKWQEVKQGWDSFLNGFQWSSLLKLSALKIISPLIVGYLEIASCLGFLVYLSTFIALRYIRKNSL